MWSSVKDGIHATHATAKQMLEQDGFKKKTRQGNRGSFETL